MVRLCAASLHSMLILALPGSFSSTRLEIKWGSSKEEVGEWWISESPFPSTTNNHHSTALFTIEDGRSF